MINKLNKYSLTSIILLCCIATYLMYFLFYPVVNEPGGRTFEIKKGSSIGTVVKELHKEKIISHPLLANLFVHFLGSANNIKAGEYYFAEGTNVVGLLSQIHQGKGLVHHSFAIIPGWTFKDVRNAIAKTPKLEHTIDGLSDKELMQKISGTNKNFEGSFLPDTYNYATGVSDIVVLKNAYYAMQKELEKQWDLRDKSTPYDKPEEAIIAASLIEKEAYFDDERPVISGVIINRLQKNMLLQIDATVIFSLGDKYKGKLTRKNMSFDSPYNTYVYKGLPPGPIAMPSLKSIKAALHPKDTSYIFYVARNDGSHRFSETYVQHKIAITASYNPYNDMHSFFNTELVKYYFLRLYVLHHPVASP